MKLHEWTIIFVKHKDLLKKNLEGYTEEGDRIDFSYSDRKLTTYVLEDLSIPEIVGETWVVTLQTKKNIDFLIEHWSSLISHPTLTIIFANPGTNEKWMIRPSAHNIIADDKLEQGIRGMAEHVALI